MKKILLLIVSTLFSQGNFSGVTFFDYAYYGTEGALDKAAFTVGRSYLTYTNNLGGDINYKFQTDIDYKASPFNLYLKNANVEWKCSLGTAIIGLQGMNVFNIQEKTWGHRFIQKSPMDKHGFSSSADLGFGFKKKINNISVALTYTNGSGYKYPENDKYKKTAIQAYLGESNLSKNNGFNLGGVYSIEPTSDNFNGNDNVSVFGGFFGYSQGALRIGAECNMKSTNITSTEIVEQIIAGYATYIINDKLEILTYIDWFDKDIDAKNDSETYLVTGINYTPAQALIISPNIRIISYEDSTLESDIEYKINFQFKF